ncbi:MAG: threonine-phosphate decarboxylase CobD [Pseudomonadota bacterium]
MNKAPRQARDHGGALDAAIDSYGGTRATWLDLSTGINPDAYPIPPVTADAWTALPDRNAHAALVAHARRFWNIPDAAAVLPVPGASAAIAQIPRLKPAARVHIPTPTYNEHMAAFALAGWTATRAADDAQAQAVVHPNNPDGRFWTAADLTAPMRIIDESFCDVSPDRSLVHVTDQPGTLVLKSFGKFWGLAGLRLGFVIGDPGLVEQLAERLGPWPVSGIALEIGARALADTGWAEQTRTRLAADSDRVDAMMTARGATVVGGTPLFRLYDVPDARVWQHGLAQQHIWTRTFPYSDTWVRLGLPAATGWDRLDAAL